MKNTTPRRPLQGHCHGSSGRRETSGFQDSGSAEHGATTGPSSQVAEPMDAVAWIPRARGLPLGPAVSMSRVGGPEGRRSVRCLLTVPLAVSENDEVVRAHTVVVNAHGALIIAPRSFRPDSLLRVVNQDTGETALCRVAWRGGEDLQGLFKIGIELQGVAPAFWGVLYDPVSPLAPTVP